MRPSREHLASSIFLLTLVLIGPLAPRHAGARLATDVAPTSEAIHLRLDADQPDYSGLVRVDLDVRRSTRTIQLHSEGQKLEQVTLTQKGKAIPVAQEPGERGMLTLTAERPLARGAATLEIRFSHAFNTQAVSLYRMEKDGQGYLFTQFEAEHARSAFPCWDEPSFKIPYQVTLEVPEAHQALFNTPIERETVADRWKTLVFKKTPPMPSYLLAIATGPLEFTPIPGSAVPARIVTVKGQSQLAAFAAEATPHILHALEAYFRRPYPYEKLDLIAVPEYWFGAMENPGAITFTDRILLLDPQGASPAQRKSLVRVTAHELSHMWFGDLVTMAWWDDMWLNESFADWMGDKITDQLHPEYKHALGELESIQEVMETDARPSTDAIRQPVTNGDEAMRTVGIAYDKGKAVLAMFEHWMGPETFRKGVNDYLKAHEWKNAVAADLWSALATASGKDVSAVMGAYIEHPGLALVTVEPLPGGSLRLSQKRFLNYGVKADPLVWQIPMSLKYSDGQAVRATQVVLGAEPQTVKLEGASSVAWVMPNAGARGYYRWRIPQEMLLALARQATTTLDPAERIAFLGNLAALLDAGEIHGDTFLRVLGEMADDPEPIVATAVIANLEKARLAFVPDDLRDAFAVYVRRTLKPMSERFGLEKRAGEEEAVSLLRPQLIAWLGRDGHDETTLRAASEIAAKYMSDASTADPAVAGTALQLNALRGDHILFDRYRSAIESATVPAVRQRYLGALGYFNDPAVQDEALTYALEGPLRANEWFAIPGGIASRSDRGADRTFQWIRDNWPKIAAKVPSAFLPFFANTGGGCSAERLAIARTFFTDSSRSVPGMEKQLAKVADQVNDCVGLRGREGAAVVAYLRGLGGAN